MSIYSVAACAVLALSTFTAFAEEGFQTEPQFLSPAIQKVWFSTVKIDRKLQENKTAGGSGFIVACGKREGKNRTAIVATNSHVVRCATSCKTTYGFADADAAHAQSLRNTSSFKILYNNPDTDLAVVAVTVPKKSSAQALEVFKIESDRFLPPSTPVWALGFPQLSLREKKLWHVTPPPHLEERLRRVSRGKVISDAVKFPLVNHLTGKYTYTSVVVNDADLMPGNSGGPLVNEFGQVVGINTAIGRPNGEKESYEYRAGKMEGWEQNAVSFREINKALNLDSVRSEIDTASTHCAD